MNFAWPNNVLKQWNMELLFTIDFNVIFNQTFSRGSWIKPDLPWWNEPFVVVRPWFAKHYIMVLASFVIAQLQLPCPARSWHGLESRLCPDYEQAWLFHVQQPTSLPLLATLRDFFLKCLLRSWTSSNNFLSLLTTLRICNKIFLSFFR